MWKTCSVAVKYVQLRNMHNWSSNFHLKFINRWQNVLSWKMCSYKEVELRKGSFTSELCSEISNIKRLILQVLAQISIPRANLRGVSMMCTGEKMVFISLNWKKRGLRITWSYVFRAKDVSSLFFFLMSLTHAFNEFPIIKMNS